MIKSLFGALPETPSEAVPGAEVAMNAPAERPGTDVPTVAPMLCCPEAQADGVPCPTLGRPCAICERLVRSGMDPTPPIDWPMVDR
jgi:hypothetical protein